MSDFEIPESWAEAAIDETAEMLSRGKSPKYSTRQSDVFAINQKCVYWDAIRIENRKEVESLWFRSVADRFKLKYGDILVNSTGTGTLGRVNVWIDNNLNAVPDSHLTLWRPKLPISPFFMSSFLRSFEGQKIIQSATSGSTNQIELSKGKFGAGKVPIPPAAEQHRIVAKIESTHSKIAAIEKAVTEAEALLKKYRESLLAKAFRGELVPQDPNDEPASKLLERIRAERAKAIKNGEIKKSKKDELPPISDDEIPFDIPKSWEWVRLGEIIALKHGYAFKSEHFMKSGRFTLLTPGHFFERGGFRDQRTKTKFLDISVDDEFVLRAGDMLIAMTEQAPGLLGSAAWIPDDGRLYLHNQRLGKISAIGARFMNLEYVYQYFNASYLRAAVAKSCTGSTVRHTSSERVLSVLIPLPPASEQLRIASAIQAFLEQQSQIQGKVNAQKPLLRQFSNAILAQAFSGRLVPQDPSEGTGHELLAQILNEKQSAATAKETKKTKAAKAPRK